MQHSDTIMQVNTLTERFYTKDVACETTLSSLMECVRPAIRKRLQEKHIAGDDLEDLYIETAERLLTATRRSREQPDHHIGNYMSYALTVADTVFEDHIRRTKPNWCRLKRRILYLLDNKAGTKVFARWRLSLRWLGGLFTWQGQKFQPTPAYNILCSSPESLCNLVFAHRSPEQVPLPELLARLFRWLETPLEVDELTNHVAHLQGIADQRPHSLEGLAMAAERDVDHFMPASAHDVAAEVMESLSSELFRKRVWNILCEVPPRQRMALLFAMPREEVLLLGRVTEIAAAVELPLPQFAAVWQQLPLSDKEIADRLEITPKQVSNLRKCARERLYRWLARKEAEPEQHSNR
jgi:RNA polymerase sigma factor (sigma-70 family)